MSFTAPVSLLTCIMLTKRTSSPSIDLSMSTFTRPVASTPTNSTSYPTSAYLRAVSNTEGCSTALTIILPLPRIARIAPEKAILLLSVAPDVNMISFGVTFIVSAIRLRAPLTAFSTVTAGPYALEGLKYVSVIYFFATSAALPKVRVVALLSR